MALHGGQQYGTKTVSQAAALALRQLQDQLSAAYTENAQLQQQQSDLRADMHASVEAHRCELGQSEAHAAKLTKQVADMRLMLEEMRDALETTADENSKLSREAEKSLKASSGLEQELETSRSGFNISAALACQASGTLENILLPSFAGARIVTQHQLQCPLFSPCENRLSSISQGTSRLC